MIDFSNLDILFQQTNLAKGMDEKELAQISSKVINDFENDMTSRQEWEEMYNEWIKLATQVMEVKSFRWDNASNVGYGCYAVPCSFISYFDFWS
jgi:F0F1-type ATP synthase gamma subunit